MSTAGVKTTTILRLPMAKAIFVDFLALKELLRDITGSYYLQYSFKYLCDFLVFGTGTTSKLYAKPFHTLPTSNERYRTPLMCAGFEPLSTRTETRASLDDQVLIDHIAPLTRNDVSEIVVVTSDSDFADVLVAKHHEGIDVHIVTSLTAGRNGTPALSYSMRELIRRNILRHVPIEPHVQALVFQPHITPAAEMQRIIPPTAIQKDALG
jgi:hypothetical protein